MSSFKTKLKFDRKKLFIILLCSLIFIVALTSVLLAITNNNKDKENKNTQTNYEHKINDLYDVITDRNNEINNLNAQIDSLNTDIKKLNNTLLVNESDISTLTSLKNDLDKQVKVLTATKLENETTIAECQLKITNLTVERDSLNEKDLHNTEMITNLNTQINNLQVFVNQLQNTNATNSNTINSLTNQIVSLNSRINDLTLSMQENINQLAVLNSQINDLENSIKYYETYVNNLATNDKCVVTFYFNGSVYNIQVVSKGSKVQVVNPTSTDYVKFNNWYMKLSDDTTKTVDLSTETFSENTKIQANITYSYDVKFMVGTDIYNTQIVEKDNFVSVPVSPTKSGYAFDGWSINGVDVISNINTIKVTNTTTYFAVFTKLHTVKFIDDDNVVSTQTIRNGNYANVPSINTETYKAVQQRLKDLGYYINGAIDGVFGSYCINELKRFQSDKGLTANGDVNIDTLKALELTTFKQYAGWKVNENLVDVATYKIVEDTTFVSDYTLYIQTIFSIDGVNVSQYVQQTKTATAPSVTSTEHKVFKGWFVNDEKIDVANYPITKATTFTAKFDIYYDVIFQVDSVVYDKQLILSGNCATVPTNPTKDVYPFIGWSIDGENVISEDISTIQVTANMTYIALFNNYVNITFANAEINEKGTYTALYSCQERIGSKLNFDNFNTDGLTAPTLFPKFIGWATDGANIIDTSNYIVGDTDTVFYPVYGIDYLGTWIGSVVVNNTSYSMNLSFTRTGIGFMNFTYMPNMVDNVCRIYSPIMSSDKFLGNTEWNMSLVFNSSDNMALTYTDTSTNNNIVITLTREYSNILSSEKYITTPYVEYNIESGGASIKFYNQYYTSSRYGSNIYSIINNKIYYMGMYAWSASTITVEDIVITTSYIKIGDTIYYKAS